MDERARNEEIARLLAEHKKRQRRNFVKYGCLPIACGFAFIVLVAFFTDSTSGSTNDDVESVERPVVQEDDKEEEAKDTEASGSLDGTVIPGLAPVDVYGNLEEEGFTTERQLGGENGNFWICKNSIEGIDYNVTTFSFRADDIRSIKATAMVEPGVKNINATKPFFLYISTLPYEGSDPQRIREWINENFDRDKSSTVIGGVRFTINGTEFVRVLNIHKDGVY